MKLAIVLLCALLLAPVDSLAHRVNVFAWIEGDTVHVQAGFSRKNPARQSSVSVLPGSGADVDTARVMLSGTTDDSGKFSFPLPPEAREHGLTIRVNAGQGHQNTWSLKAEECAVQSGQTGKAAQTPGVAAPGTLPAHQPAEQATPRYMDDGPRLRDIVGGLGWIVGLVGIGMALHARKRYPPHV